nr:probable myosin-binding protein 5 isoform X1 [Ipomoea batatas]
MEPISFKCFVEQNLGRSALFLIYSVLEFVMIVLLLVDGFLAFFSYEFAKFFELKMPCFFCTRIDQALVHRNLNYYYNDTICESHKRDISSLSYCHVHKKISDIKTICENCVLSFAPDKDAPDYYAEDIPVKSLNVSRCSCCMQFLRGEKYTRDMSQAPPPSPKAWRNDEGEDENNVSNPDDNRSSEEGQSLEDSSCKTPSNRGNKFFGIPLSDSPRVSKKTRNMSIDYSNNNDVCLNEGDGGMIQHLKRQVLLERKSMVSVCVELDEERNASAIAANNAMAMITRLQAEKASMQMKASQYQRMMEEQAEYDREEKQILKDMILKREEEIEVLESELDVYREKFGPINLACSEFFEIEGEGDDEFHSLKFQSLSSFGEISCFNDVLDHHEVYLDSDNDRSHHSALLTAIPETKDSSPPSPQKSRYPYFSAPLGSPDGLKKAPFLNTSPEDTHVHCFHESSGQSLWVTCLKKFSPGCAMYRFPWLMMVAPEDPPTAYITHDGGGPRHGVYDSVFAVVHGDVVDPYVVGPEDGDSISLVRSPQTFVVNRVSDDAARRGFNVPQFDIVDNHKLPAKLDGHAISERDPQGLLLNHRMPKSSGLGIGVIGLEKTSPGLRLALLPHVIVGIR